MAIDRYRSNEVGQPVVSTLVVYALWFFLGFFGVHRFVTGRVASGLLMLLLNAIGWATVWLLGLGLLFLVPLWIWWVVDALLIPGWLRER